VVHVGYSAAFLVLGGIAALGLVLLLVAMPETQAKQAHLGEVPVAGSKPALL
jgi:predicted MFS family arabinose efflux permease